MIYNDKPYQGQILIADGKINIVNLTLHGADLTEIGKLLALKNILDQHLADYEKNYKRC